nr:MAG TPA: hypothetical protein [Herelleviridae sp.]
MRIVLYTVVHYRTTPVVFIVVAPLNPPRHL